MAGIDTVMNGGGSAAYEIQQAAWRDLNALRQIEQACFELDAWPLLDLVAVLTFPDVVRLKAVTNGKMVGFIAGDRRRSERLGWITTLGVLPEYRRRGIAVGLLELCEKQLGMPEVRLSVRRSNEPAIQLYRRCGYRYHGIWQRYYIDGEDALILAKEL